MKDLKTCHEAAAEQFEKAAEHHRTAAEHLEQHDYETAAQHAHLAYAHALLGHEQTANATKQYVELETVADEE